MPTQPQYRKFFVLSTTDSSYVTSEKIPFPFRRWDDGLTIIAARVTIPSGSDSVSCYIRMHYKDIGWTDWGVVEMDDGSTSFTATASGYVFHAVVDKQTWWKMNEGIQVKFERNSGNGLEVRCVILAR